MISKEDEQTAKMWARTHSDKPCWRIVALAIDTERDRAAEIADEYECGLLEYPSHEARTHYESGLIDAREGISKAIRGDN